MDLDFMDTVFLYLVSQYPVFKGLDFKILVFFMYSVLFYKTRSIIANIWVGSRISQLCHPCHFPYVLHDLAEVMTLKYIISLKLSQIKK